MATYIPHYPPAHTDVYVKATSTYSGGYYPHLGTDPAQPLTGEDSNGYVSGNAAFPAKFNIDHGAPFVAARVYIENYHHNGSVAYLPIGMGIIRVYGTNSEAAFNNLDGGDLTDLALLGEYNVAMHVGDDIADPQYFLIPGNTTPYRYTSVVIVSNQGAVDFVGLRHIEMQEEVPETWVSMRLVQPMEDGVARVFMSLVQPLSGQVAMRLVQPVSGLSSVAMRLSQWMAPAQNATMRLVQPMQEGACVAMRLVQPMYGYKSVAMHLVQPIVMGRYPVAMRLVQPFAGYVENVAMHLVQPMRVGASETLVENVGLSVTVGGRVIEPDYVQIGADITDGFISATVRFPDYSQYVQCMAGEEVVIVEQLGGPSETTYLIVDSLTNPEEPGAADHIMTAISATQIINEELLTEDLGPGIVGDILVELCARYGIVLDYQGPDNWPVAVGDLSAAGETAYEIMVRCATDCGCCVQSTRGGGLRFIPEYGESVNLWDTGTTVYEVDEDNIFSLGETEDARDGYNVFLVGGSSGSSSESYQWEEEQIRDSRKLMRCYVRPWPSAARAFDHTGGDWVSIDALHTVAAPGYRFVEDEEVEIVGGVGSTQYPVSQLVTTAYRVDSLGEIIADYDGNLSTEFEGDALVSVSYMTVFLSCYVTDPVSESVQLTLVEVD